MPELTPIDGFATDYSLEVLPGFRKGEGVVHRPGACVQDCPHCPLSVVHKGGSEPSAYVDERAAAAIEQTVRYLYRNTVADACSRILLPAPLQVVSNPLLDKPLKFYANPRVLSLALGDLKVGRGDHYEKLLANYQTQFPTKYEYLIPQGTDLNIAFRVPLSDDLSYKSGSIDEAVLLGQGAIASLNETGDPAFNRDNIILVESINAVSHAQANRLLETSFQNKKVGEVRHLIAAIFRGQGCNPDDVNVQSSIFDGAFHLEMSYKISNFNFRYYLRAIPHRVVSERMPLSSDQYDINIAFMPDSVWVHHHTHFERDESLRFSYPDYSVCLMKAWLYHIPLRDVLNEKIRRKRAY